MILIRPFSAAPYLPTLEAMRALTATRDEQTPDEIWLVEHPPVFTQGLSGKPEHVLTPGDIPVIRTERGGQVTYHGPGQVVAYTLIDLRRRAIGVRDLVCRLEAAAIDVCAAHGVRVMRKPGAPGLYLSLPEPGAKARDLLFEGTLETRGVEVSALTAPSRTLTGRLDASTTLSARINPKAGAASITDALRTQTRFTVNNAVLQGVDLSKSVVTVGLSRGGSTELDTLAGQVRTRGQLIELTNLVASSGVLAATGEVTVAPSKALSGRVRVDVTRGGGGDVVGVPLVVGGTVDDPSVSLSRSALLGAAIGTALMPGVGTGAGANLGDRLGEGLKDLFGK